MAAILHGQNLDFLKSSIRVPSGADVRASHLLLDIRFRLFYADLMKAIVILGTGRGDSNTLAAVRELCPFSDYRLIDLRQIEIAPYSYDGPHPDDDFLKVAQEMESAEYIVFATPVYWYAMSASLKNFFDRLSDLLSAYKPIGKGLKGKKTYLISTGSGPAMPPGFEEPFRLTSEYFDMEFQKSFYKSVR